ncbi:MAG: 3-dehydroquinate synthase [Rhodospirillaceae bacterium]|jgi:3-dehydroquinate synthase|nr:3-dehydroquinate synthase [Rhodospirillaceae bacterium]MBT4220528.1 3-dehydroquinate synthase [Rhodospirillaceae bacterium]MBT4464903.1 3-dehydroquinate synthase [Rhodospirillaceae bacterium]MBT5013108.1 3-dehydroquinate synthase [Rhodospirillaceae bacterium]MBT5308539.1 3-dehydroquinate synthase [Rhodospirillaceae bacterium]
MTDASSNNILLHLDLGDRSYDIAVDDGLLGDAGHHIAPLIGDGRAVIVSDSNVAPLYLGTLENSLDAAGIDHASVIVPAGEASKSFAQLESLTDEIFKAGIDRKSMLIALGGGVIGDLCGFASAITMRGIDFIQIPTSLLAQVDSSVGGKTGINSSFGKNLIGAFHQPRLVIADLASLDTLAPREMRGGYAEIIKYGLINDVEFFDWLENNGQALINGDRDAQRHAVLRSCAAKADVVAEDEKENGRRALLNLGHTFGHALEAETGYGDALTHGEAVSIGMCMAFDLSARLNLCPEEDAARLRAHLQSVDLPTDLGDLDTASWTADALIAHMGMDKKTEGGTVVFIMARGIGKAFISRDIAIGDVRTLLNDALNG